MSLAARSKTLPDFLRAVSAGDLEARRCEGSALWELVLHRHRDIRGSLVLEADWLRFVSPLPARLRSLAPAVLLLCHSRLPGTAKIGRPDDGENRLLLDVSLAERSEAVARCRAGMAWLLAAWEQLDRQATPVDAAPGPLGADDGIPGVPPASERGDGAPDNREPAAATGQADAGAPLPDLLAELNWRFTSRDDGRLAVDLDAGGPSAQALIGPPREGQRGMRLWMQLLRIADGRLQSRDVLADYLLRASHRLRLVRPAVRRPGAQALQVGFETHLPAPVTAAPLDDALHALATAGGLCGRELRALTDERIAARCASIWCPAHAPGRRRRSSESPSAFRSPRGANHQQGGTQCRRSSRNRP